MLPYAILGLQIRNLLQNFRLFHVFRCFPSNQQHVFRRVFHLDELHHLRLVAEILQNQGADGVGDHHSLTLKEKSHVLGPTCLQFHLSHLDDVLQVATV